MTDEQQQSTSASTPPIDAEPPIPESPNPVTPNSEPVVGIVSPEPSTFRDATAKWIDQLVDLSGNNKLLFFRPGSATVTLDPLRTAALFEKKAIRLGDLTEPITFDASRRSAEKALAKARENFEERGLDTLFMGIGLAKWNTDESKAAPSAPVLLRPLERSLESRTNPTLEFVDEWVLNPSLVQYVNARLGTSIDAHEYDDRYLHEEVVSHDNITEVFEILTAVVRAAAPEAEFAIEPSLVIGNFSYAKLPMVLDLQNALADDGFADSDLLRAIGGDVDALKTVRERLPEVEAALPDDLPPGEEFLVLTADSSQSAVINAVLAGADLAVEGPPGTGKSQTIANLIASLAARGERVLFVAEKRAAIDAVTRNLTEAGLSQLVLDLHGATNARSTVAKSLSQSLANLREVLPMDDLYAEPLKAERDRLAQYSNAVVEVRQPWQMSFDGALQKMLETPPDLRLPLRQLLSIAATSSHEQLSALCRSAEQFAESDGLNVVDRSHPWHEAFMNGKGDDDRRAQELIDTTARLFDAFNAVVSRVERACDDLGFSYPSTLDELLQRARLVDDLTELVTQASEPLNEDVLAALVSATAPADENPIGRAAAFVSNGAYRHALKRAEKLLKIHGDARKIRRSITDAQRVLGQRRQALVSPLPIEGYRGEPLALALGTLENALQVFTDQSSIALPVESRLGDVQRSIDDLYKSRDVARRLHKLHALWAELRNAELATYLEAAAERKLSPADTRLMVSHGLYRSVCDAMQRVDSALVDLPGQLHRETIARFSELDARHVASTSQRILRLVAEHAVDVRNEYEDEDLIIQKQARLQRRHMPVRQLLEQAPHVATALRPCWAMSPLVVAQVLPRAQLFDVVIFDEASQVTPADAIGSLLRAKRAVVAGDRRQLPPTSFWQAQEDDTRSDEPDAESILDAVAAIMPDMRGRRMLNWHYRSRDERLIAFSNAQPSLYDWSLETFSDAGNGECLIHEVVPQSDIGVHKDGSNPGEVQHVVTLVRRHIIEHPDETLGVITMGAKHKNAVLDALHEVSAHDPLLRTFIAGGTPNDNGMEPFFVKNLETVQGDQRDAIIISVGYAARNQDGSLNHNFGPINIDGGERRLNVAVTRAKNRVTVVTAFEPGEIRETEDQKEGVKLLARYVKYAASGGADLGAQHRPYPPLNPFELDIKRRLEEAGIPLIAQHGVSGYRIDFAAQDPVDPSRFVLAIECDGASYHSRPTVRDRDRLRQAQLERLGWRFSRIWSTDWFENADAEVARVVEEWKQAVADKDIIAIPEAPVRYFDIPETERPLRGIRPELRKDQSLSAYSDKELYDLADWIQSDNIVRTTDEIIDEMFEELGVQRRTASARDKLHKLLAE